MQAMDTLPLEAPEDAGASAGLFTKGLHPAGTAKILKDFRGFLNWK